MIFSLQKICKLLNYKKYYSSGELSFDVIDPDKIIKKIDSKSLLRYFLHSVFIFLQYGKTRRFI
jgi:hypothetical protein